MHLLSVDRHLKAHNVIKTAYTFLLININGIANDKHIMQYCNPLL